jgi:hypothetical protein
VNVNCGIERKGSVGASGAGRVQNVEIEPIPQAGSTFCTAWVHNVDRTPEPHAISTFSVLWPHNVDRMPDPRTKSTLCGLPRAATGPGLPSMPQLTFTTAGAEQQVSRKRPGG